MRRRKLVFVCTECEYVNTIEYKLVSFLSTQIEVEFIITSKYINEYFETPRKIDILIISPELYEKLPNKPICTHIHWLLEEEKQSTENDNCSYIYKYSSVRGMVEKIGSDFISDTATLGSKGTQVVSVFSVVGGSGKTLAALSMAYAMRQEGKKALYISTESIQDFKFFLNCRQYLSPAFEYQCSININRALEGVEKEIQQEDIEYLLPFKRLPLSYQIDFDGYLDILTYIQKKNIYDCILVEVSKEITPGKLSFLQDCDRMVLVTTQEEHAVKQIEELLNNMTSFSIPPIVICNRFKPQVENYLSKSLLMNKCEVSEYINEYEKPIGWEAVKQNALFSKTAGILF